MQSKILNKLEDIFNALSNLSQTRPDISLMEGDAGILLFLMQYENKILPKNIPSDDYLSRIFNVIETSSNVHYSFSDGLLGVHWLFSYLEHKDKLGFDYSEITSFVNHFYTTQSNTFINEKNIDYLHGIGGFFIPSYKNSTETNINTLLSVFESSDKFLLLEYIYKSKDEAKFKFYNLGLAHGYASYMNLLSLNAKQTNLETITKIKNVIDASKIKSNVALYPDRLCFETPLYPSRLAWCYGDLGIASAFFQAGKAFNNQAWKQEGIDIMLYNANRVDAKQNGVLDAAICHGAAGVAHMYNRFYKETQLKEFDEARWYWLNQTLNMASFDEGPAGYKMWQADKGWQNNFGFLEGIAGIGLVLLGFLTDDVEELDWDRCLLLS